METLHEGKKPDGTEEAWSTNMKMVVAREQALMEERQSQMNRIIEDTIAFRKSLDNQYLSDIAGIRLMEKKMYGDFHVVVGRKELKGELRDEEMEETINRNLTTSNEAISGIVAILEASGLLGAVVGAAQQSSGTTGGSQQTSGKTGGSGGAGGSGGHGGGGSNKKGKR